MMQRLTGVDPYSGAHLELRFSEAIEGVDHLLHPSTEPDVYVAPGWIDLQVNGFAGVDYNVPGTSSEQIAHALQAQFATGVTRLLPTVITASFERIEACLKMLAKAKAELPDGHAMDGFHVEGPYISPDDGPRGAHPVEHVRKPDWDEFQRWQDAADGGIKLTTISPEWPETPGFIENCIRTGVVASIGHTKATAEHIQAAVSAGATMSTHIGNGAHQQMVRHPNYIWDQLAEDRLTASFICDGIHLGNAFLKSALRAKTVERAVLITDAVMPAGCSPGRYSLGGVDVELHEGGKVTLVGGWRLAGSSLHMHEAIGNVMRATGVHLTDALTMASRNPARAGRIRSRLRGLETGERADFVKFRFDKAASRIEVLETWVSGRRVFNKN